VGLKSYFGRNEKTAVIIIALLFFLAAISISISSAKPFGTAYKTVDIAYVQEGTNLKITEKYTARVGFFDQFNVLYRSFEEPICLESLGENCNFIISSVTCEKGTPYVSKTGKPLLVQGGNEIRISHIGEKIKANEIGCYNSKILTQETTSFSVTYLVPQAHVAKNKNNHVLFSKEHFAINKLEVQGLQETTSALFIPADKTVSINTQTGTINAKKTNFFLAILFSLLFASIPYLIWKQWGTEKTFVVPEYLHTIPDKKIAPWQADVLTNGTFSFSKNGMASILMELYSAKIVKVQKVKKFIGQDYEFSIDTTEEKNTISEKARTFLEKLKEYEIRKDGKTIIAKLPQTSQSHARFMQTYFKEGDVKEYTQKTYDKTGYNFIIGLQVISFILIFGAHYVYRILVVFFSLGNLIIPGVIFGFTIFFILAAIPASVFSRFKEDNYKNYLEWQAFNKMLKDYAQMKKYLKEDHSQWKEWLIYATALGSAENLLKSLKELQILSPTEYEQTRIMHTNMMTMAMISHGAANPHSSGGGGMGGMGGGGGFGGGGGGGR
jgi:uncharacterized membrane protein